MHQSDKGSTRVVSVKYNNFMNRYFVYFMASNNQSALYIGVTNNMERRITEHKQHVVDGFSKRYNCVNLVYFEETSSVDDAIAREKQLKKWSRRKKDALVIATNPEWKDLSQEWE